MAKFEHCLLDKEGLKQLLIRIRDRFATQKALADETVRAKYEEAVLTNNLNDEINRATIEEIKLDNKIIDEINRASLAEAILTNNLNDEINRAKLAEETINNRLIDEINRSTLKDEEINNRLTDEINRSTLKDEELTNNLNDEINRAKLAETTLNVKIIDEINRSTLKDEEINNRLTDEINRSSLEDALAKNRLDAIESGTVFDTSMSDDSIKGVQNKVIKAYVDEKVTAVYRYKGSKETYEKLVAEETATAIVGDVWNVEKPCEPEPGKIYQGGTNFAWTGEKWDALGSSVDLSNYYTKKEVYNKNEIDSKEKALQINIDTVGEKLDKEISDRTTADGKLDKRITDIEDILPTVGKVDNVWLDGIPTLDTSDKIAKIKSENVKVLTEVDDISGITGEINKLYRSKLDKKIYQWDGTTWKGIGDDVKQKAYIVVKDTLPTEGEEDVFVIKSSDHTIHQWVGISEQVPTGWQEIGGKDKELREDFTAHLTDEYAHAALFSKKANSEVLAGHMNNLNNPHGVTKLQIGLGNVDNTADADKPISAATQTALNNKVDLSTYTVEIGLKVNYTDIKDNLDTVDPLVPLSANQGTVLDAKIRTLDTKMQSFGSALLFRGVVPSIAALELITEKNIGDCYQINSQVNSEINDDSHDGEMWAWNGTSWVKIVATATDLSSMLATTAEINKIISDYE